MILASVPGNPGALDVANGYVYFAADGVISRVAVTGGAVQLVAQGLGPTGIAAAPTVVYLGDGNNETIDQAMIGVPDGGFIGLFATSAGSTTQVAIGNGGKDLYWGDWFGGIDHCPIAMPYHVDVFGTPCSGGACYPRHVRAYGPRGRVGIGGQHLRRRGHGLTDRQHSPRRGDRRDPGRRRRRAAPLREHGARRAPPYGLLRGHPREGRARFEPLRFLFAGTLRGRLSVPVARADDP